MVERKYIKFRVDMYEGTKFKIIDRGPERDLIHYVWSRIVILAGKVNLEGELYISKNIPYTTETLAIEFNRDIHQIKSALDVLIELEMIELNEDNIYVVKNFAKHQNIKAKNKIKSEERNDIEIKEIKMEENPKDKTLGINSKKSEDIKIRNEDESVENNDSGNLEIINKDIKKIGTNESKENINDNTQNISTIQLDKKKNKRPNRNKKKDIEVFSIEKDIDEDDICCIYEGEKPLLEGERYIMNFDIN